MATAGTNVRGEAAGSSDAPDFLLRPTGWPFKDPHDYLEGKRADDGVPADLWRIHDDLYDLSDFKHPGGADWLDLTRGTDITELVETHHLDADRVQRLLPLYRVDLPEGATPLPPRRSPFTFEPTGFYCTLRRKIWAAHGGEARQGGGVAALGPSTTAKRFADTMVLLSVVMTVAVGKARSWSLAALCGLATGVLNGVFVGIGHNFLHQEENWRRHMMDISGFSSSDFRLHHALSHHPYSNTVADAEINTLSPEVTFFPREEGAMGPAEQLRAKLTLALACILAVPAMQARRLARLVRGQWPSGWAAWAAQIVPAAQVALLAKLRSSKREAAALWLLMQATTSSVFLGLNFLTGPHFNDQCWHQGDTLDSRDWGVFQLQVNTERSSLSQKDGLPQNLVNITAFGLHHLHHLFPTIDAAHLSQLVPLFEAHCREWGATFETLGDKELAEGLRRCIGGYKPNARTLNGLYTAKL